MQHETVTWAYDDMDAARRLWPRVKTLIEKQISEGDLELSLSEQRRLISAVVGDLLEQEKRAAAGKSGWCAPKPIEKLLRRLRKSNTTLEPHAAA